MRKVVILLSLMAATVFSWATTPLAQEATVPAPEQTTTPGRTPVESVIPDRYIVVLEEEVRDPTRVAREHAQRYGAQVFHTYQHALKGYAARIPDRRLEKLRADERIDYVELDQRAYASAQTVPWGIDRVDADLSSTEAGNGSGAVSKVNAYMIDANMSLAGPASRTLDEAVKKSARSGVFYSLATGDNGASNTCKYSPARAGAGTNNGIATVAATNRRNAEPSWSNYGRCVDIWAPGVSILSTKMGGGTATMSGVSQASPHVGGGAALYLSSRTSASPSRVETALKTAAKKPGTKSKDDRVILLEYVGRF